MKKPLLKKKEAMLSVIVFILALCVVSIYQVNNRQTQIQNETNAKNNSDRTKNSRLKTQIITTDQTSSTTPLLHTTNGSLYFLDPSNNPIALTGVYTNDDLVDHNYTTSTNFNFDGYLSMVKSKSHNFMRLFAQELFFMPEDGKYLNPSPLPWSRTGPGNAKDSQPKFDLIDANGNAVFNQDYFDRLQIRVAQAQNQGIYISVMFFDGWGMRNFSPESARWDYHPFNPTNNADNLDGGGANVFHTLSASSQILNLQKAYVRKVIDTVNSYDNVIYEIANEDGAGTAQWQYDLISYVKQYESSQKPKKHPVGMTVRFDNATAWINLEDELYNSSADWISLGGTYNSYASELPAADISKLAGKVVIMDTDHIIGQTLSADWMWKAFMRGYNPVNYEQLNDPSDPNSYNVSHAQAARDALGQILSYAKRINLSAMRPNGQYDYSKCSLTYCLINPNLEYLVYGPGNTGYNLTLDGGNYTYEWFNPDTGTVAQSGTKSLASGTNALTPPFSGPSVLYLKRINIPSPTFTPTPTVNCTKPSPPTNLSPASGIIPAGSYTFTWNPVQLPGTSQNVSTYYLRMDDISDGQDSGASDLDCIHMDVKLGHICKRLNGDFIDLNKPSHTYPFLDHGRIYRWWVTAVGNCSTVSDSSQIQYLAIYKNPNPADNIILLPPFPP